MRDEPIKHMLTVALFTISALFVGAVIIHRREFNVCWQRLQESHGGRCMCADTPNGKCVIMSN